MCGILCTLTTNRCDDDKAMVTTKKLLRNRGPDLHSDHRIDCNNFTVTFFGYVLWQQGLKATKQPMFNDNHVMLFNGDIYSTGSLAAKLSTQSDTEWLFTTIMDCNSESDFYDVMRQIQGPYSMIYLNADTKRLYIARDSLGRQTLLIGSYQNCIHITSVASKEFGIDSFEEVPAIGVFCFDLSTSECEIKLNAWQDVNLNEHFTKQLQTLEKLLCRHITQEKILSPFWMKVNDDPSIDYTFTSLINDHSGKSPLDILTILSQSVKVTAVCDKLIGLLTRSVKERVEATPALCKNCMKSRLSNPDEIVSCDHPKIGILFSGGIDCTILAVLADRFIPKTNAIDLVNVSFEKIVRNKSVERQQDIYETPDRLSSRQTLNELIEICPERKWNLIEVNVTRDELKEALTQTISNLCFPLNSILDESLGAALWFAASANGTINSANYVSPCRVLLVGSGADELFAGYTRHRNAFLRSGQSWENLDKELNLDWTRLPSRNLARDDRIIGDHSVTARSPYVEENLAHFVRNLKSSQKCFHSLPEGIGDKLLLRLCGFRMGLRNVCWLKKRALQFGSRIADRKQNAKDVSVALR